MPMFTVYTGGRTIQSNTRMECRYMRAHGYTVRYIAEVTRKPEAVIRRWTRDIGKGRTTSLITSGGILC